MQSSITWREFLRQTLTLALPIAFQQLMLALSSCADTLMLTNVGQNELSAVSLATQFQFIFSLCLAALTLGMSILVAQYWGAGNTNAVERVLAFIMLYAGGLSLVFFALTLLIPETLMSIMTNDATLIAIGSQYLRVSSVSYLFIGLSQMYLCLMKNVGAAVTGMTVSTIGVIVHVALNAVLIYGWFGLPALGIFGAAIPLVLLYFLYDKAVQYIMVKFSILENIITFLPVSTVYQILLPIGVVMGIGIGFLGSFFTVRKHLKV